jgi:hypothetical protein
VVRNKSTIFVSRNKNNNDMKATFVTREFGKNPADITREEFIKMMIEDVDKAKVAYRQWSDEVADQRFAEYCKKYSERRDQMMLDIINTSYKKYKKEYYRARWVATEIAKIEEKYPRCPDRLYAHIGRDLTSIYWDIKPWQNGCTLITLDERRDLEHLFGYLYDESIKNKYFIQCTGWSIVQDYSTEFRFHLSDELQAEWKADVKNLADEITRFYAGSNYWGD